MFLHQANQQYWKRKQQLDTKELPACQNVPDTHSYAQLGASFWLLPEDHAAKVQKLYYFCVQQFIDNGGQQLLYINFNSWVSFQPHKLYTWVFTIRVFPSFK